MAVSNTYGRVRKPVGFHLIGSFMTNQGLEGGEGSTISGSDCSIWMPIAPSGYTALGCVAHLGNQPPPNHVVHCVRTDLVTSTAYSDCLFSSPSNIHFATGFSIWRVDNAIGSFFAHSSIECPPEDRCFDLNHLLLWNSNRALPSPIDTVSDFISGNDNENQHTSQRVNTSGWDVLRSISKATNCYMSSPNFERIWWDRGSDLGHPVSIWRPISRPGYAILGDCITEGLEPPALGIIFKNDNPDISAKPVQFTRVAHIMGKGVEEVFLWYPTAPPGYVSLGCVVSKTDEAPRADLFCCPRMDLVSQANIHEVPLSRSSSSREPQCWSIWKVENQASTFLARSDLKKPSSRLAYIIGDSVKPKTRENITAELKLRFFSLTVLDSICGMAMTPLFDTTITNIKLATHGRLESMNAVLISSIAASTFNAPLEAWEPLVEPFDGIFKFETYHTNAHSPSGLGKRVRIASTNILNVNVSAANLESFVGSILSWRRQLELEHKDVHDEDDTTFSALDEDDLQTVIVENKLGCDIYIRKVEQDVDAVDKLHHGDCSSVWIPPPRFSDRLNVSNESREARYYIAVTILEAKGLPLIDDGNSYNFFCALRLLVDSQATEQQKLFPQSARTKCVKPVVSRINDWYEGTVTWNELFIFEVPQKAPAKLEIEVTNLAAKSGKGDIVSALSFPVGRDVNILRKVPSVRMVYQPYDVQNIRSYPLKRMVQPNISEDMHDGNILVSTSYFERNTIANLQKDVKSGNDADGDVGFWIGLGPEGEWKSVRSLLPLSVAPKSLQNEFIAMEVVMKNGKKHAIFRSLVTVVNDSDVGLNISTCNSSLRLGTDFSPGVSSNSGAAEDVFQNQYFHPTSGWGNKWPSNLENPGHWSTRDFSFSSKDFFEPPLPPGWKWMSGWSIDKSQFVDSDGWAYGPDLRSLKWPPSSSKFATKSTSDVVRRRRWIRPRQLFSERGTDSVQSESIIVDPGASTVLSWKSTSKDSDKSLYVKPRLDDPQSIYSWGCAVAVGSSYIYGKDQLLLAEGSRQNSLMPNCSLKLNQLEKKDVLMCCNPSRGSKLFWFSVGTDASILNTELNAPVYDWKISINSPMKLENRLPCPAEFTVWEKTKEGNCVEQHHGVISSRQSVHIYSADIQKPLYLTLSVQDGWLMEKDPILVLDPSFTNRVTSFWMVHQQSRSNALTLCGPRAARAEDMGHLFCWRSINNFFVLFPRLTSKKNSLSEARGLNRVQLLSLPLKDGLWNIIPNFIGSTVNEGTLLHSWGPFHVLILPRKLRVSIEYDMGGTSAAPKTLRLFVPYWIVNDSSLALAYRVVEVEPLESSDMDSVMVSRAVKSAKTALKNPLSSLDKRYSSSRRNLQVLEAVEDNSPFPSMLSPHDYAVRTGVAMFQSQKDTYPSPRVGIAVALYGSEVYSSGISLLELENKERIDIKAFDSNGFYYKLSALLNMTSDRTKVVHFQPHTLFINRAGCSLCMQQCDSQTSVWIHPTDPPKPFGWQSSAKVELLKLRMDGYQWSMPFSVNNEGVMRIILKKDIGDDEMQLRVVVRSGAKRSRYEVIFCLNSSSSPYRIENRSMFLPIRFRQVDGVSDSWKLLLPNAAASFLWEDVGRRRLLELLVDGTDPLKSLKYDIDEISDHQPVHATEESNRALGVTIVKEEKINVVKISDWMPETEPVGVLNRRYLSSMSQIYKSDSQKPQPMSLTDSEFHIFFELAELGISLVDHTPEEILYLSIQNLVLAYSTGLGSGINRFKLRMRGLQVDNQLPLTPMPVLFRPQRVVAETDYILKFSMTMQSNGSLDLCVYPFIGLYGLEKSAAFLINIHEPIIWRLHEMIQQVKFSRLYDSQTTAASVDPIIQIGVLNISEVRFRVSMAMSPSQRPRGVLGFWASLMTALGNTENMSSSMISMAISNIRKDLLGQPLQLLSGVDILGNASSALGHMSKGVAALSMDKKFIQSRQRQETKGVEDFGDVIREGGGALAKGLFRGVTGILTKPLEGAKTSGVEGFVQGVGKGIIGAAAQPVSGVLDLLSKTTEGANAMRMKIASAITSEEQLLRRRLPRVISGDNLLQLYDEYKAQGQVILQLAESGSFFGQVDLFKVRGKFALSDAYEDHFLLPKGKILMVTHRRVILLQQPSNIIAQRKFSPARDPCSILWDVLWDNLGTMELTHGKKDSPKAPPSRLILYLHSRSLDSKENVRTVKCNPGSQQALEVYLAIEHAMNTYGPNVSKETLKKVVTKPYSPIADNTSGDLIPKEGFYSTSPPQMPGSVPLTSTFGSGTKL
ncbi:putative vacuolar protein sorting-associated protein 13A isoform A [Senna tora]|uniref:Putative vacuolar protein sorting-associated protein 13A isoform A n=1 Tax=Senna tora TaxID=362788 RepID=A0A834X3H6_9FABA|nr:putative vacuolar protein sorting-associated protein 13A isoform A [Senna tora]